MFYSKYDHFGKMYSSVSKRPLTHEFIHMGQNIRELPRSLGLMIGLLIVKPPEDKNLLAFRDKLEPWLKAIEERENKERADPEFGVKKWY